MSEIYAKLTERFPPSAIKHRQGGGGKSLAYVAGGDVIRRILNSVALEYSWKVTRLDTFSDSKGALHWLCIGTLHLNSDNADYDGVGTNPVTDGDSPKGAETDAFKRAARLAGVALELYEDDAPAGTPAATPESHGDAPKPNMRVWTGDSPCPSCHAPSGKPHGSKCEQT